MVGDAEAFKFHCKFVVLTLFSHFFMVSFCNKCIAWTHRFQFLAWGNIRTAVGSYEVMKIDCVLLLSGPPASSGFSLALVLSF